MLGPTERVDIGVLNNIPRGLVRAHDKFRDDAKPGGCSPNSKEQVWVLRLAGAYDAAVRGDNFDLDNVVQCRALHPRHGTQPANRCVAADTNTGADSMCKGAAVMV